MYFRYCPKCGKELKERNNKLIHCRHCDFHFYFNSSPTNAVILHNKNDEILLVKKKVAPKIGQWDLPGGFVELGETMEEATKRELKEELGIAVKNLVYFRTYCGTYPFKGSVYQPLCSVFIGNLDDSIIKEIIAADDASEYKFFSKENIPWDKIAFIDVKTGLKEYLSSFHQPNKSVKTKK